MIKIKIKGLTKTTEHTLIINNQVFSDLFESKKIDVFETEGDDANFLKFLSDDKILAFIGYRAALEGAKFEQTTFPYNETMFRVLMSKVTALQIQEYVTTELLEGFQYAAEKLKDTDNDLAEAEKKD